MTVVPRLIPSSCNFCATRQARIPSPCTPQTDGTAASRVNAEKGAPVPLRRGIAAEKRGRIADNSSSSTKLTLIAAPLKTEALKGRPFFATLCIQTQPCVSFRFESSFLPRRVDVARQREGKRPPESFASHGDGEGRMRDSEPRLSFPVKRPDLSGSNLAPRCSHGVHFFSLALSLFYNRDDNERFWGSALQTCHSCLMKPPDNRARIKRPL